MLTSRIDIADRMGRKKTGEHQVSLWSKHWHNDCIAGHISVAELHVHVGYSSTCSLTPRLQVELCRSKALASFEHVRAGFTELCILFAQLLECACTLSFLWGLHEWYFLLLYYCTIKEHKQHFYNVGDVKMAACKQDCSNVVYK